MWGVFFLHFWNIKIQHITLSSKKKKKKKMDIKTTHQIICGTLISLTWESNQANRSLMGFLHFWNIKIQHALSSKKKKKMDIKTTHQIICVSKREKLAYRYRHGTPPRIRGIPRSPQKVILNLKKVF